MVQETDAFKRFRFSFFEDRDSARNGLDQASLTLLSGEERMRAETMLIDFLPDARAVIGLSALRSRRAEDRLSEMFESELADWRAGEESINGCSPDKLIWLAKALWRIRANPVYIAAICDVLINAQDWTARSEAACALDDVGNSTAAEALEKALDDPDELVRHHAARALFATFAAPASPNDPEHPAYRIMSEEPSRRAQAKREILSLTARSRPL